MLVTYLADIDASPASQKGLFIAFSKYEERDIPKQAGWRWDASTKRWFTSDPEKARRLESYAAEIFTVSSSPSTWPRSPLF